VLDSFGVRFLKQVWPGDTLRGKATVTTAESASDGGRLELEVVVTNQHGEAVVSGSATATLPRRKG